MDRSGLIDRLDEEGWYGAAAALRAGLSEDQAVAANDSDEQAVTLIIERWKRNRHGKQRKARRLKELRREVADLKGERDRARIDRDNLIRWVEQNHQNLAVTGKSGQRVVVLTVGVSGNYAGGHL